MKLAYFIKKQKLQDDGGLASWLASFEARGCSVYRLVPGSAPEDGTDAILAIGGDGTFLSAASLTAGSRIPLLGVNRGRLGFLSENRPEDIIEPLLSGNFTVEKRDMLEARVTLPDGTVCDALPGGNFALNEIAVLRAGVGMIGVEAFLDGDALPIYWADGILVATSSGSTAYNLSVGGPICLPDVMAHIIAPIAPHNLNVRPLIAAPKTVITLEVRDARKDVVLLSLDNRSCPVPVGTRIEIFSASFQVPVIRLGRSNFIEALKSKLYWGEDIRNLR